MEIYALTMVASCGTCDQLLVYAVAIDDLDPESDAFEESSLIWPDSGRLADSVPETVRSAYATAFRVGRTAPEGFALLIRRALEILCEDRDARGGSLHARLQVLSARGDIPPVLAEMTDVLRVLGNEAAHRGDVAPGYVRIIDEFFRAVVEYVYVAPANVKAFRESLSGEASRRNR